MKIPVFVIMLALAAFPAHARAEAAGQPVPGESKVVVEIPRTQWCQCVRAVLGVEGGDIAGCVKSGASEEKLKIFRSRGAGDGSSNSVSYLLSFAGCSESENENVGSLAFNTQWQGMSPAGSVTSQMAPSLAPIACEAGGISTVEITLYKQGGEKLASAGPWNCSNVVGTLKDIPVGSKILLVVIGKNASGEVLYRGERAGITIAYKQTTTLGNVAAPAFAPFLSAPVNAAVLGSGRVRFSWAGADGAVSYQLQVSDNPDFTHPVVDTVATIASYETGTDLSSGAYFWRVKAVDGFNNSGAWSASGSLTIDAEAPVNTTAKGFINKGATATNDRAATLSISATKKTGVVAYYVSERSKKPEAGASGWTAIPSTPAYVAEVPYTLSRRDGEKTVSVWFKDVFGHVSEGKSDAIIVDTTMPRATILSHPAHPTNATTAHFTFSSAKTGAQFQCRLDEGLYSACSGTVSYEGLAAGQHTFMVKASDTAGNIDRTPAAFTWTIDLTPSHTSITSQPPALTETTSARFKFSTTKKTATLECRLDAGDYGPCSSPKDYKTLADGPHTFMVRATDALGNIEQTPAQYTWTIDTPLTTTITEHPANPSPSESASFSFTTRKEGATFQCRVDDSEYSLCTSPFAYAGLSEGGHTFSVKAIDAAGKEEAAPAQFAWSVKTRADAVSAPGYTLSDLLEGLPLAGSPTLAVLGVTPPLITRPASPRAMTFSAVEGTDQNGAFQFGVAVDAAPYLLLSGLSLEEYQKDRRMQVLSNIQLSFAGAKGMMPGDEAARISAGVCWTIWDDGDVRLDRDLLACIKGDPQETDQGVRRGGAAFLETRMKHCRDAVVAENWNRSAADIGFAPSWVNRTGKGDAYSRNGYGAWATISYGFDRFDVLNRNSQIVFQVRYRNHETAPLSQDDAAGAFYSRDRFSLAVQYRFGLPHLQLLLQEIYLQTKSGGQSVVESFHSSAGAEFRLYDAVWLELQISGFMRHNTAENPSYVSTLIKWTP